MRKRRALKFLRLLLLFYGLSVFTWTKPALSAVGDLVEFFNFGGRFVAGVVIEENDKWITVSYQSRNGPWTETLPIEKVRWVAGNAAGAQAYLCRYLLGAPTEVN